MRGSTRKITVIQAGRRHRVREGGKNSKEFHGPNEWKRNVWEEGRMEERNRTKSSPIQTGENWCTKASVGGSTLRIVRDLVV
jgi:hypothetical protein